LLLAVDDTMFRRSGRKVHAAHWGYDGSLKVAKGNQKLSRGNTFVVAAVVVALPFLDRPVALPAAHPPGCISTGPAAAVGGRATRRRSGGPLTALDARQ
jgi:hypothetical protein